MPGSVFERHSVAIRALTTVFGGTAPSAGRFYSMTIEALTGVVAVSVVVALMCHLWPPPDDSSGPGGNAP